VTTSGAGPPRGRPRRPPDLPDGVEPLGSAVSRSVARPGSRCSRASTPCAARRRRRATTEPARRDRSVNPHAGFIPAAAPCHGGAAPTYRISRSRRRSTPASPAAGTTPPRARPGCRGPRSGRRARRSRGTARRTPRRARSSRARPRRARRARRCCSPRCRSLRAASNRRCRLRYWNVASSASLKSTMRSSATTSFTGRRRQAAQATSTWLSGASSFESSSATTFGRVSTASWARAALERLEPALVVVEVEGDARFLCRSSTASPAGSPAPHHRRRPGDDEPDAPLACLPEEGRPEPALHVADALAVPVQRLPSAVGRMPRRDRVNRVTPSSRSRRGSAGSPRSG